MLTVVIEELCEKPFCNNSTQKICNVINHATDNAIQSRSKERPYRLSRFANVTCTGLI